MGPLPSKRNSNSAERARSRKKSSKRRKSATTAAEGVSVAERSRGTAAVDALAEMLDGVPAAELRHIRDKLRLAQSCSIVVGAALKDQNVGLDSEAADILGTHVTDALHIQLMKLDRLLGREVDDDDIEEGEGGAS